MSQRQPLRPARSTRPLARRGGRLRTLLTFIAVVLALLTVSRTSSSLDALAPPGSPKTALVLTAHPDDESMFFSPSILGLIEQGWDVRGLCLSHGNADGLGETRREELVRSFAVLGVSSSRVESLDDPQLQDGMDVLWDPLHISQAVQKHLDTYPASMILTFDQRGISGHLNHMSLFNALRDHPPFSSASSKPRVLALHSPNTLTKYTGPLLPLYLILCHYIHLLPFPEASKHLTFTLVATPAQWVTGWKAMLEHKTQLVWFRWLYLLFSRLMWVNQLVEI